MPGCAFNKNRIQTPFRFGPCVNPHQVLLHLVHGSGYQMLGGHCQWNRYFKWLQVLRNSLHHAGVWCTSSCTQPHLDMSNLEDCFSDLSHLWGSGVWFSLLHGCSSSHWTRQINYDIEEFSSLTLPPTVPHVMVTGETPELEVIVGRLLELKSSQWPFL